MIQPAHRILATGACFLVILIILSPAVAETIPVGVQTDVSVSTVLGVWGWTVAYQNTYADANIPISTVFANVPAGDYVMLAAKPADSSTFTVLAAALESDIRTYTPLDATHTANDVNWYYNGGSMGFAEAGGTIVQGEADVSNPSDPLRLSWHTTNALGQFGDYANPPQLLQYGWRAGAATGLNGDSTWQRYVLYASAAPVPEPATLTLLAAELLGLGAICLRRRGATA